MQINFTKMQVCGNDYIYIDCINQDITNYEEIAAILPHRHYSVGADGVVFICRSEVATAKMRLFNHDASEGRMGGNAIGCVARYLFDKGMFSGNIVDIETISGIKRIKLVKDVKSGGEIAAKIHMDKATPLGEQACSIQSEDGEFLVNAPLSVLGKTYYITTVSMGNPHCIVFCDDVDKVDIEHVGHAFEMNAVFPERVNTEFVQVIDNSTIKIRVWERGNKETLACGTGACAAAVAAVLNGYCEKDLQINVQTKGGNLYIKYNDDAVFMTGVPVKVFDGVVDI